MNFKLNFENFADLSVAEVKNLIDSAYKKPLRDLKFYDLLLNDEKTSAMRHGIYLFFTDANECIYIGMCSSSHFAHRIGGHFGMSPNYDMNTFLKRMVKQKNSENTFDSYVKTLLEIDSYGLLMISVNGKSSEFIKQLEKLFHRIYKPSHNFPKGFPRTYKTPDFNSGFKSNIPC